MSADPSSFSPVDALYRLENLLDVICQLEFDRELGVEDERVSDLLWIARDCSNAIADHYRRRDNEVAARLKVARGGGA